MQIFQVDAFAEKTFQGNPAAVVPLQEWLPDALLQNIAMENNLSETAYILPRGKDYEIRWFTPTVEVELCGHATLASGHVVFEHLGFEGDTVHFHSRKSGILKVTRRSDSPAKLTLDFPNNDPLPVDPLPVFFEGLRIAPRPLFKGAFDYMIVLDDQRQVEALSPDFKVLAGAPGRGVVVTAKGEASDFVSRCFYAQSGIDEDPVTGSAHTMMVPYWAKRLGKTRLSAIQLSRRRGYLDCELAGDRVLMSGSARSFLKGELILDGQAGTGEKEISIRGAQRRVDEWIRTTGVRYFSELTNMAILTEEVGEVARLMSRLYGDQSFKESDKGKQLSDELADVLWVLLCIANQTGTDLTAAFEKGLEKKNVRDATRHRENEKLK